jgi:predicted  nucleic acid-binding Zn-ribbon protein
MNHAAYLIQGERDELNELCELKEQQIQKLSENMSANNNMIQSEVMKLNEERQAFNKHVADLNKQIKELKNGDNN